MAYGQYYHSILWYKTFWQGNRIISRACIGIDWLRTVEIPYYPWCCRLIAASGRGCDRSYFQEVGRPLSLMLAAQIDCLLINMFCAGDIEDIAESWFQEVGRSLSLMLAAQIDCLLINMFCAGDIEDIAESWFQEVGRSLSLMLAAQIDCLLINMFCAGDREDMVE